MKIHNKRELQRIAINHSADIDHKDFRNYSKITELFREIIQKNLILFCLLILHYLQTILLSFQILLYKNHIY